MDDEKKLELRVGLTIFVAAVILSVGMLWFQGFEIGKRSYELNAVFPMVGGIDPGDEVNVNGVEKGEVKRVELAGSEVRVRMAIYADVRVPDDSQIILQTIGIMGERVVSIILGSSERYIEPGSTMQGIYDPGMSEVLASFGNIMGDLSELTKDISAIAEILTEGDDLKNAVGNLAEITEELKEVLSRSAPRLEEGVDSFNRSAARIDGLLERNSGKIDSVIAAMERTGRGMPELVERISSVTESLAEVVGLLESDESTMGALLRDRQLLDRLERTIQSLDELVTDMKANPHRYLKIEVF
ncbi:MAG TPA: MCE family protein [Candidatus Eisenbacteria bacterium]|uniref:MCE family protein n=1 Tax=Eiseniibacteriota bacterium TaxID=2212470 RepID=A0A7V2AVD2_UNCEI|nr:MCE family protein [Candidatus Eisenbacteria bacterium]